MDVRGESGAEVVENDDVVAAVDERVDEVRPDETRSTRHQDSHRGGG